MFDIGWTELLLIGIVALIVIGPKDLPGMFHTLGRVTARLRSMARDFTRAMQQAAKESGVDTVTKDLRNIANPRRMGLDAVKDAATKFESWNPLKEATGTADKKPGPNTAALSQERAEAKRKIHAGADKKAGERVAAENAGETAAKPKPKPKPRKTTAKKPAAKKPAKAVSPDPAAAKSTTKPASTKRAPRKTSAKTKKADG